MHGPSRLSNGVKSLSPPTSPRHHHGRNKNSSATIIGSGEMSFVCCGGSSGGVGTRLQNVVDSLGYLLMSVMYRRRAMLLFAPLLYISGMLLYMGTLGIDVVNYRDRGGGGSDVVGPGSIYRSPEVFQKLWPFMEAESNRSSNNMLINAWNPKFSRGWKPCLKQTISQAGLSELPKRNGFLIIEANGGLNQQRLSICDAVAVAGLLNATLVIPIFHLNSVWRDSSKFADIFDEEFFIYALRNRVDAVRELPELNTSEI